MAGDDGEQLLRDYLLATEDYPAGDIEAAVNTLVKGVAPGVNPSFRPKPPEVGAECRRQLHLRLDSERRTNMLRPALPAPEIEHTPESRERMKAILEAGLARLETTAGPEQETELARSKAQWDKVNARFYPDMNPRAMRKRLGFSAGDPEGDEAAA